MVATKDYVQMIFLHCAALVKNFTGGGSRKMAWSVGVSVRMLG